MKKLTVLMLACFTGSAFAAGYGTAGCGLGSMLLGDQKGMTQIFASTTNGTSGSQTFGISSGTSNCGASGKTPTQFIEVNKAALTNEAARGEGETITALSEMYGCKEATQFGKVMKKNYKKLFNNTDSAKINSNIKEVIVANKISCDLV